MSDTGNTASSHDGSGDGPSTNRNTVLGHMMENKVETTLWLTRIFTVVCTVLFIVPIVGDNPYSFYQRALLSAAATSALRLHQRLPNVRFNMDFLRSLLVEDASHYLLYCIIFLNSYPMTMILIPLFLFALLHACSYTKTILNLMGPNSLTLVRNLITKLEAQQVNILRFIASIEIFMMPAILLLIFSGKASLFLPFIYYRFLTFRYASRRNPYNRLLFSEFYQATMVLCNKPQCPQLVRNLCYKAVNFISWLAPVAQAS
ncbi:transmembrane protein 33-like [Biomphalaria glabrata]|uniref:Transmembrane protein 33-like n=1 Tax=Biomphalaria glabrata TaxID=6526 RepID=A0A9W3B1L6_BIOGL|nr:transmembrane protein 33-like [Biomphalaria glabrata]